MLKSKTADRICRLAMVVMLVLTVAVWTGKAATGRQKTVGIGYEGLFDQSTVHTIDLEISDWDSFIATAASEEYTECTVTVDGEKFSGVGVRAKGNTSLSSVASLDSEKYSLKIEFDHYVKGRLYNGLDKLSLNNLIYDATMMKDYVAYTLMAKMGVPSPLCSYAEITVNGEYWGLYLAVEGVEDSFMKRNNMTKGELYKPDSLSFGGGRGNGGDFDFEQFRVKDDEENSGDISVSVETTGTAAEQSSSGNGTEGFSFPGGMPSPDGSTGGFGGFSGQMPEGMSPPEGMSMPEGFDGMTPLDISSDSIMTAGTSGGENSFTFSLPNFGGNFNFGMGGSDVKLFYTDDDPDSYANIFDNAKTSVSKMDKARLIETLKTLNSDNARDVVYTDEIITYLAVHDFLQNGDSYTGMMVHNYYLYEEDGKLAIIPWDYNLAFGGMGAGSDASSAVNSPVDSPVSSGSVSDRPLISWIFGSVDTLNQYHETYSRFICDFIESGWLKSEIERVAALIRPYVEADANSFYSSDEFDKAVEALQSYCSLRGESIRGQLEGTIPSTSEGQRADSSELVDTGSLALSDMGVMNTGGQGGGNGMPSMPGGGFGPGGFDPGSFGPAGSDSGNNFGAGSFNPFGSSGGGSFDSGSFSPPESGSSFDKGTENTDAAGSGTEGSAETASAPGQLQPDRTGSGPPEGFSFPENTDTSSGSMPWAALGIWAAILLAALLLVMKMRGHER